MYEVDSSEHALVVGLTLGTLLLKGVDAVPEMDDEGNYLASLVLTIGGDYPDLKVRLIVEMIE